MRVVEGNLGARRARATCRRARTLSNAPFMTIRWCPGSPSSAITIVRRLRTEVVGNLVDLRASGRVQPGLLARRDQRRVQRVLDAGFERRVEVGEAKHVRGSGPFGVHGGVERHHAGGQRSRLVGAQHVHAAEVLDRLEAADDHAAARHVPRAARERDADDRGQQLGRDADGEGHGEQQRFDRRASEHLVDREHEEHHDHHDAHEQVAELPHAARELGFRRRRLEARRHVAECRVAAGLHDEDRGRAAAHGRSHERAVGARRQRRRSRPRRPAASRPASTRP